MDFDRLYRTEGPRALATLIRLLGDFDLAEEMLQDAFATALAQWPDRGVPANPTAWLVSTARHKALDRFRRESTWSRKSREIARTTVAHVPPPDLPDDPFPDDMLRLIFTCCHPALAREAQIALTLKTVCGLTVDEIARAFLVAPATMAQRLVRAKAKIRKAGVPYAVPGAERLGERLDGVLRVVYLVFTEGYAATAGEALVRAELCKEAIRLARLLHDLLPDETEVAALLALVLLQDSRRRARVDAAGDLVLLEHQDRGLWDRERIREGLALLEASLARPSRQTPTPPDAGAAPPAPVSASRPGARGPAARSSAPGGGGAGFYALQAAIAAVHARAERADATDWPQIAALYELLLRRHPSPVVALNRAVAVAMAEGPEHGLALIDELASEGSLRNYHPLWSARADLLRRLGRLPEAAEAYEEALRHVDQDAERRYLERRLAEARSGGAPTGDALTS